MHRDVHIKNLFMMRFDRPEAVLGDFGKTIQAHWATDQYLGPIQSRAPEVDGHFQHTNKTDIWSLGTVLLRILDADLGPRSGYTPTPAWYQASSNTFLK